MNELGYLAARLAFGKVTAEEIRETVDTLLSEGIYCDEFVTITDANPPTLDEVLEPFRTYLRREGIALPDKDRAVWLILHHHLERITAGTIPAYEGLRGIINDVYWDYDFQGQTKEFLGDSHGIAPLMGLYWGRDDLLDRPTEVSCNGKYGEEALREHDREIRKAAKAWMEEFGEDVGVDLPDIFLDETEYTLSLTAPGEQRKKVVVLVSRLLNCSLEEARDRVDGGQLKLLSGNSSETLGLRLTLDKLGAGYVIEPPLPWQSVPKGFAVHDAYGNLLSGQENARFRAEAAFHIPGRGLVLSGVVVSGTVSPGMSFTVAGFPVQLTVRSIEHINYEGPPRGLIGLALQDVDEELAAQWKALSVKDQELRIET
jgi:hypothetical protein